MTEKNFHEKFDKQIGNVRLVSYGGGAPRTATIERMDRTDATVYGLNMEECRDLHYALGRLLDFAT